LKQFDAFASCGCWCRRVFCRHGALGRLYASDGEANRWPRSFFRAAGTGVPKGVMLTHRNILSNVDAVLQVFQLQEDDVLVGVLPFFHSFGFNRDDLAAATRRSSASSTTQTRRTPRRSASSPGRTARPC
jgi:hypothetical protein